MTERLTSGRYPGYDVMSKRESLSWNDKTREVIDARLGVSPDRKFLSESEWLTLKAVCDRVMPQTEDRPRVPLAAFIDRKLLNGHTKGYRFEGMPQPAEAWKRGLEALDEAAERDRARPFAHLTADDQDELLRRMADGTFRAEALKGMPAKTFWSTHVIQDILSAYYAHPEAWNEIGWAGPASPRGYIRLGLDKRDPWEPAEAAQDGDADGERRHKRVR